MKITIDSVDNSITIRQDNPVCTITLPEGWHLPSLAEALKVLEKRYHRSIVDVIEEPE